MKDFIIGVIGTITFFFILYLPIDSELKNLLIGVLCLLILIIYIAIAKFRGNLVGCNRLFIISLPTLLLMTAVFFNFVYQLEIGGIYLWVLYALLTAIALKVSAGATPID